MCRISLNFEIHFLEDLDYFNFCNFLNVFIFLVMKALIVETLNKYIQIQISSPLFYYINLILIFVLIV